MTTLWKRWTVYCAIGELIGIASAGAIAYIVNDMIGEPKSLGSKLIILLAMMLAGFIEGMVLSLRRVTKLFSRKHERVLSGR